MIRIVTVVGARPQFIKSSALSRCIHDCYQKEIQEIVLHTGQHYDDVMSEVFFRELSLRQPDYRLDIGQINPAIQISKMLAGISKILDNEQPDAVMVFGDTNTTLAGAIAAYESRIPLIHVEAGLRSSNPAMPEEINRIIADRMSTILFCPTKSSYQNIENEIPRLNATPPFSLEQPGAILCGDIMFDHALHYAEQALENRDLLLKLGIEEREFILCTVHRQQNTDNPERLKEIFEALMRLSEESGLLILIPMHPRTSAALKTPSHSRLAEKIRISGKIKIIPPVSYLEMLLLEQMSEIIVTDSGGVQKEAYFFKKPSVILRSETEWTEIAETGSAILAGNGADGLANAYNNLQGKRAELVYPPLFGDGDAAAIICQTLIQCFNTLKS